MDFPVAQPYLDEPQSAGAQSSPCSLVFFLLAFPSCCLSGLLSSLALFLSFFFLVGRNFILPMGSYVGFLFLGFFIHSFLHSFVHSFIDRISLTV